MDGSDDFPFQFGVIFRFQPLVFGGVRGINFEGAKPSTTSCKVPHGICNKKHLSEHSALRFHHMKNRIHVKRPLVGTCIIVIIGMIVNALSWGLCLVVIDYNYRQVVWDRPAIGPWSRLCETNMKCCKLITLHKNTSGYTLSICSS